MRSKTNLSWWRAMARFLPALLIMSAALPAAVAGFETGDEDEGSITLGASLVKPYQYSGEAGEFTVNAGGKAAAASAKVVPAEGGPDVKAAGEDHADRP